MVENAGYDCAFTNFGGGFVPAISRFDIPRMHVTFDMSLPEFRRTCLAFMRICAAALEVLRKFLWRRRQRILSGVVR